MTVLRLEIGPSDALDTAIAVVGSATLARRAGERLVEVAAADADRLVRALAFGGIAASRIDGAVASPFGGGSFAPSGYVLAVGSHLEPLPVGIEGIDVVRVRRLSIGEATREVLRRRLARLRPPSARAREACRRLLRGQDALFAWDRRAWIARAALREARARSALRPVVFDRHAADRVRDVGRSFASDKALARWIS